MTGVTVLDIKKLESVGAIPLGAGAYAKSLGEYRLKITQAHIKQAVSNFEKECKQAHIRYGVHEEKGDPFSLMISLSRYYDLVIFGLKSIFDYGLVREPENALTKFVREGVRPILAIGKDFEPMKRVLIAYSGSMHSAKAMKHFVQLRLWPHMKIKIIVLGKSKKDAQDLLRGASEYCKNHGLRTELEHVPASGKEQLIKQAKKWNADLIVMGNSMRNLFLRQTLGDIALHTIQHSNKTLFLSQ